MSATGLLVGDVLQLTVSHCEFSECGIGTSIDAGLSLSVINTEASFSHVLYAKCRRGLFLREEIPGRLTFSGSRMTFADNAIGVHTLPAQSGLGFSSATIGTSIFAENGEGLLLGQPGVFVSRTVAFNSGTVTGSFIAAFDPEFRGASAGDYRLTPSSPAIDRITIQAGFPIETLDGDLSTNPLQDYGALEFAPLSRREALLHED